MFSPAGDSVAYSSNRDGACDKAGNVTFDNYIYTSERGGINDEEPMVQEVVFGPQMYGERFARRLRDGFEIRLTHNKWEEGDPFWLRPAQAP